MGAKYVGRPASSPQDVVTLAELSELKASTVTAVQVITGEEERPEGHLLVFWLGGVAKPTNMADSDIQFMYGVAPSPTAPTITTTSLNAMVQGSSFTQTLSATGTEPITFAVMSGTLPAGLNLNEANGTISGTPSATGAYSFTIEAANDAGSDTQAFSGTVSASGTAPVITTTSLNAMTQNSAFSQTPSVTGSTPITWGVSAGTIPAGLGINSSSGLISGTLTDSGAYDFTVEASNAFGSDTQQYTGTITAAASAEETSLVRYGIPSNLSGHSDAGDGKWLGHMYYVPDGLDMSNVKIVGVKVYVPASATDVIGTTGGRVSVIRGDGSVFPGIGFSNAAYEAGNILNLPTLVAGWNTVMFPTPIQVYDNAAIACAYELNGNYLYGYSLLSGMPTGSPEGDRFGVYRGGVDSVGLGVHRSTYDGALSNAAWYGIEPIFSVAGGVPTPSGPWVRRSPFRAPGVTGVAAQTVNFDAATAGNKLLLVVAASAAISTPSGWTPVVNALSDTGLYAFTKTATADENSVSITTSANNYTVIGVVYEFASTMTIAASNKTDSTYTSGTQNQPALTGLTGTNIIISARSIGSNSYVGSSWDTGLVLDAQMTCLMDARPSWNTGGIGLDVVIETGVTGSIWQKGGAAKTEAAVNYQSISLAVKI